MEDKKEMKPDMPGAVCFQMTDGKKELLFEEILSDQMAIQGEVWVNRQALCMAGGINDLLESDRNWELLLRIAKLYRIVQADSRRKSEYDLQEKEWMKLEPDYPMANTEVQAQWKTNCYLVGRYKREILETGLFDKMVMKIIADGGQQAAEVLEQMLKGCKAYYRFYDNTQPILIYTGEEICYHVLDTFAKSLGQALQNAGNHVIYFNLAKQELSELSAYVGMRLKAVVGMQTYVFSLKRKDGRYLHDLIHAPLYHFIFDHPVWLRNHLLQGPEKMMVLTPDANYAAFVQEFYPYQARFLPPAGENGYYGQEQRRYDISFLGTYDDSLLDDLRELYKADRKKAHMVSRYILFMRQDLQGTPEKAFQRLLDYYDVCCTKEEFEEQFAGVKWVMLKLAHYYRKKTVEALLKEGITLHVFGDSWKNSTLCKYPSLICHEQAIGEQALEVYGNSKLALNIMTWHKDGFTERIANAMLQKSVVVTDWTGYLENNFTDDQEIIIFNLDQLRGLPQRINRLLEDDVQRMEMAKRAYQKALKFHTWDQRARQLLDMMKNVTEKQSI